MNCLPGAIRGAAARPAGAGRPASGRLDASDGLVVGCGRGAVDGPWFDRTIRQSRSGDGDAVGAAVTVGAVRLGGPTGGAGRPVAASVGTAVTNATAAAAAATVHSVRRRARRRRPAAAADSVVVRSGG